MSVSCLCCGRHMRSIGEKNHYNINRCECGFSSVENLPSDSELHEFYSAEYFNTGKTQSEFGYENKFSQTAIEGDELFSNTRLAEIEKIASGRLLDIGCAEGNFLRVAKQRGWWTAGVELSGEVRRSASRYTEIGVFAGSQEALSLSRVDVVTMWEYLEHVLDPVSELEVAKKLLGSKGLLCMSFPNGDSYIDDHDFLGWEQVKPPEHLHCWTLNSIELLLEKCGFDLVFVRYHGFKPQMDMVRRFGRRSNPKTLLWPFASVCSLLFRPIHTTMFKEKFPSLIRRSYEGFEIYASPKTISD